MFPQQCFPRWANRETLVENIMFPQQCFLVCPGLTSTNPPPGEGQMLETLILRFCVENVKPSFSYLLTVGTGIGTFPSKILSVVIATECVLVRSARITLIGMFGKIA